MHLVIYGAEGSGKGTQASLLGREFHLPLYTSGDLVRQSAQSDTGKLADACRNALSQGTYVSNEYIFELWQNRLVTSQAKNGFVLDGFPRNAVQAGFLMEEVKKSGYSIDKVIHLNLTDDESFIRLTARNRKLFKGSTISHDSPELIRNRLKQYRSQEKELLDYFSTFQLVATINAQQSREKVFADILYAIKNHQ